MTETKVKIRNEVGLHLRPAQQLCTKAMEYEGTKILIRFRGREFNAKSLLGLLSACVQQTDEIILVTREDLMLPLADICKELQLKKPVKIVKGGETRTESVFSGVMEADPRAGLIAVHDGARPLVAPALFDAVVDSAQVTNASAPAVPVTDTIKVADESGIVRSTPERSSLFAVQTPQVFQAELLKAALQSAITCGANITDDCAAVERLGKQVQLVPGDSENIKITRPLDLPVAEAILRAREGRV